MRGALGRFGPRIDAAYCLGLLSAGDVADLRVIQEIRNDFAHELHGLSFDSPEVQEKCGRLREMGVIGPDRVQAPGVARNRFIVSVVLLAQRIASAAEAAKHQQRNIGPLYKLAKMVLGGVETPTEPKPEP
jgi:mannitol operon repressor